MFLNPYYSYVGSALTISSEQGSRFAKSICDDFNPLHNPDNKNFCVPGDLLFSIALQRYGLSERMTFKFSEMLSADTPIYYPNSDDNHVAIEDESGSCYLEMQRSGENTFSQECIDSLTRSYVRFSGQNFPDILIPLMASKRVMINPRKPFVIYEAMSLEMKELELGRIETRLLGSSIQVAGKRGVVVLSFEFRKDIQLVGLGTKKLILVGLREYDQVAVDDMVVTYNSYKTRFSEG